MDYPAVASLNVALGNEAALHALRQQQTCYTRVGDSMLRVMREAGYSAGLVRKKIEDVNPLLLPAVMLLNGGDACVREVIERVLRINGHWEYRVDVASR